MKICFKFYYLLLNYLIAQLPPFILKNKHILNHLFDSFLDLYLLLKHFLQDYFHLLLFNLKTYLSLRLFQFLQFNLYFLLFNIFKYLINRHLLTKFFLRSLKKNVLILFQL